MHFEKTNCKNKSIFPKNLFNCIALLVSSIPPHFDCDQDTTRVHTSNIRVHTTKYGNIRLYTNKLVTYECIGATCDDSRVINMNFCLFISFLHVRRSCLAHTRERAQVTHARVPHTCATNVYHTYAPLNSFQSNVIVSSFIKLFSDLHYEGYIVVQNQ